MTNIFATFNRNLNPLQIVFHFHGDTLFNFNNNTPNNKLASGPIGLCHVAFITLVLSHVTCDTWGDNVMTMWPLMNVTWKKLSSNSIINTRISRGDTIVSPLWHNCVIPVTQLCHTSHFQLRSILTYLLMEFDFFFIHSFICRHIL